LHTAQAKLMLLKSAFQCASPSRLFGSVKLVSGIFSSVGSVVSLRHRAGSGSGVSRDSSGVGSRSGGIGGSLGSVGSHRVAGGSGAVGSLLRFASGGGGFGSGVSSLLGVGASGQGKAQGQGDQRLVDGHDSVSSSFKLGNAQERADTMMTSR